LDKKIFNKQLFVEIVQSHESLNSFVKAFRDKQGIDISNTTARNWAIGRHQPDDSKILALSIFSGYPREKFLIKEN